MGLTDLRRPASGVPAGDAIPFTARGQYHLFFLTSPAGGTHFPERVRTSWAHASSKDLLDWTEQPVALEPGTGEEPDADGVWTGSLIEADGLFHLFYTGHRLGSDTPQTICRATSTDLVSFRKDRENPMLTPDISVFETVDWRDPYVFWNEAEHCYWMLIAARLAAGPRWRRGCIALATSPDLINWSIEKEPLYAPGTTFCPECPEMFELDGVWYLVYSRFSEAAATVYRVADSPRGPWRVPAREAFDGRRWYAAKSMPHLERTSRVFFGWLHDRVDGADTGAWQWGGDFCVPREVAPDGDGLLSAALPAEYRARFDRPVPYRVAPAASTDAPSAPTEITIGASGVTDHRFINTAGRDYLFECRLTPQCGSGGFGLLFRVDDDLAGYHLTFDPVRSAVSLVRWPAPLDTFWGDLVGRGGEPREVDGPRLVEHPLRITAGTGIRCRVRVSDSLIEAYVDDRVVLSYRAYGEAPHELGFFVEDGVLTCEEISLREAGH
jgi:beta-fructofuranosidase